MLHFTTVIPKAIHPNFANKAVHLFPSPTMWPAFRLAKYDVWNGDHVKHDNCQKMWRCSHSQRLQVLCHALALLRGLSTSTDPVRRASSTLWKCTWTIKVALQYMYIAATLLSATEYPGSACVHGNHGTLCHTAGGSNNWWATFELPQAECINKIGTVNRPVGLFGMWGNYGHRILGWNVNVDNRTMSSIPKVLHESGSTCWPALGNESGLNCVKLSLLRHSK